jgi:hypothetical protein
VQIIKKPGRVYRVGCYQHLLHVRVLSRHFMDFRLQHIQFIADSASIHLEEYTLPVDISGKISKIEKELFSKLRAHRTFVPPLARPVRQPEPNSAEFHVCQFPILSVSPK